MAGIEQSCRRQDDVGTETGRKLDVGTEKGMRHGGAVTKCPVSTCKTAVWTNCNRFHKWKKTDLV